MENIEWTTIDKSDWGEGAWLNEPDKAQFVDEETQLPCLVVRNPRSGNLCGYVGVTKDHPWHGKRYGDKVHVPEAPEKEVDLDHTSIFSLFCLDKESLEEGMLPIDLALSVHGGITFADACTPDDDPSTGICHLPAEGEDDDVWWFGFDCAHAGDLSPLSASRYPGMRLLSKSQEYRDFAYVKSECVRLAGQLAAIKGDR